STFLSCSILVGSWPWCDRSWWPYVTPWIGGTLLVPSSCNVISRVESVWSARWIRSNQTRVLPTTSALLVTFCGGLTSTLGLGFFDHSSAWARRCSNSRTLVKYSSSFSLSLAPRSACRFFVWSRTVSRMLCPSRKRRVWA